MRIGLVSDVHGNLVALDAVVNDGRAVGVDEWWALGDLVAIGPSPNEVLDLLATLPGLRALRGNTERYVLTGDLPGEPGPDLRAEMAASFAWTKSVVTAGGWLDWLGALPTELRATLPDGSSLLAVHSQPGVDDGPGITSSATDDELRERLAGADADVVCAGHTHRPVVRTVDAVTAVNLGSVSNHLDELRSSYVVLHCSPDGTEVEHRRVGYDLDRHLDAVARSGHPAAAYVASFARGDHLRR